MWLRTSRFGTFGSIICGSAPAVSGWSQDRARHPCLHDLSLLHITVNLNINPASKPHTRPICIQRRPDRSCKYPYPIMSFDRLSSIESQPTTSRSTGYSDDPAFDRLTNSLSTNLFRLNNNVSRLSREIALMGTPKDSETIRERVRTLMEQTREGFKQVGEGVKKVQAWENVSVWFPGSGGSQSSNDADYFCHA